MYRDKQQARNIPNTLKERRGSTNTSNLKVQTTILGYESLKKKTVSTKSDVNVEMQHLTFKMLNLMNEVCVDVSPEQTSPL